MLPVGELEGRRGRRGRGEAGEEGRDLEFMRIVKVVMGWGEEGGGWFFLYFRIFPERNSVHNFLIYACIILLSFKATSTDDPCSKPTSFIPHLFPLSYIHSFPPLQPSPTFSPHSNKRINTQTHTSSLSLSTPPFLPFLPNSVKKEEIIKISILF